MRTTSTLLVLFLLALAALPPAAEAHGAPNPKEKEKRLLADWTDDCGGDGGAAAGNCRGSHDVIALDVQERYHASLGDVVLFRLYLDKGQSGARRDVLTLSAPTGSKTFSFQTSDDAQFSGTGFDHVSAAVPIQDGSRFYVEGLVRAETLGGIGATIRDFKVEAYAGSAVGDFMPGGCHNTIGDCLGTPDQRAGEYTLTTYRLRGPSYYARLDVPAGIQEAAVAQQSFVQVSVANLLADQAQSITVTVAGADGVTARFHNPADHSHTGYSDEARVDLPARGTSSIHLALSGVTEGAEGTLTLTLTTDAGGRVQGEVAYKVVAGDSSTCPSGHVDMHGACTDTDSATSHASPAGLGLTLPALLALALLARRRSQ